MKQKRILTLVLCFICFVMPLFAVSAAYPYLVDNAGILTENEKNILFAELTEISAQNGVNVCIVTVQTLDGRSAQTYSNDFYDRHYGAKTDGVMLLLAMEEREYYIVTESAGKDAIPDSRLSYVENRFVPDLSNGDYFDAFMSFASVCEEQIENAANGVDIPVSSYIPTSYFFVAIGISAGLAFLVVTIMKGQLKTVRMQPMAKNYIRAGSFVLTKEKDRFLYRNVTKRPRPKDNGSSSSGGSRSGGSRGGGGGRF